MVWNVFCECGVCECMWFELNVVNLSYFDSSIWLWYISCVVFLLVGFCMYRICVLLIVVGNLLVCVVGWLLLDLLWLCGFFLLCGLFVYWILFWILCRVVFCICLVVWMWVCGILCLVVRFCWVLLFCFWILVGGVFVWWDWLVLGWVVVWFWLVCVGVGIWVGGLCVGVWYCCWLVVVRSEIVCDFCCVL